MISDSSSPALLSPDMEPYRHVILPIRHQFNDLRIDNEIRARVGAATNIFLIKMELMRLASPCRNKLDLRKYFKDKCKPLKLDGVTHMVDEPAMNVLLQEYEMYGGKFTVGCGLIVLEDAKRRYEANPDAGSRKDLPKPVRSSLTKFFTRKEERIYITKQIKLYFTDPSVMTDDERDEGAIDGVTTNISKLGLSTRFKHTERLEYAKEVYIHFTEIEREYAFNKAPILKYSVIKSTVKQDCIYLMLTEQDDHIDFSNNEFSNFVQHYTTTQRRRHSVSTENVYDATSVKANEQFVLSKLDSLPLFYRKEDGEWVLTARLTSKDNRHVCYKTNNRQDASFLTSLSKQRTFQGLLSKDTNEENVCIFPVQLDQITRYVCFTISDIQTNSALSKLANQAHKEGRLKLLHIQSATIDSKESSVVPTALPDSIKQRLNLPNENPTGKLRDILERLKKLVILTDITLMVNVLNLLSCSSNSSNEPLNIEQIHSCTLKRPSTHTRIYEAELECLELRCEERYDYKTDVEIRLYNSSSRTLTKAQTMNVSTKGLKLKLPNNFKVSDRDIILVNMPALNTKTTAFKNEPYTVTGIDPDNTVRLSISGNTKRHSGHKMMADFINQNILPMTKQHKSYEITGLSRCLRNIFAHYTRSNYGILAKTGSQRYVRDLITTEMGGSVTLNGTSTPNLLDSLLTRHELIDEILNAVKETTYSSPYAEINVLVFIRKKATGETCCTIKPLSGLSKEEIQTLIVNYQTMGKLTLLNFKATKTSRVYNKFFHIEYRYLQRFTAAQAQKITKRNRETLGVVEIRDLTCLINK